MTILHGMSDRLAAMLQAEVVFEDFAKNQAIAVKGSSPFGLLYLKSGLAGLYVVGPDGASESLVAPLPPGLAAGSRLDREFSYEFTLRALSNTRIARVPEEKLAVLQRDREFAIWCSANQQRVLTMITRMAASASQKSTDRKITNFVQVYLEAWLGRIPGEAERTEWLINQSHLSDMLGVTRTHLNARLSALAEAGVVDIRRKQIYWRRPTEAQAQAAMAGEA